MQLQGQANVVPLCQCLRGDRRDVVPMPCLYRQQPFRDKPRERMVNGASGDSELGCQLVEAELRSWCVLPRENAAPKLLVDLVVEIRPAERHGHPGGPNM